MRYVIRSALYQFMAILVPICHTLCRSEIYSYRE